MFATGVPWQDAQSPVPPLAWSKAGVPTGPVGRCTEVWQEMQDVGVGV